MGQVWFGTRFGAIHYSTCDCVFQSSTRNAELQCHTNYSLPLFTASIAACIESSDQERSIFGRLTVGQVAACLCASLLLAVSPCVWSWFTFHKHSHTCSGRQYVEVENLRAYGTESRVQNASEWLETTLCSGLRSILEVASRSRAWEIARRKPQLSLHTIILSWQVYYIESEIWRHITRKESENSPDSPHLGAIRELET